MNTKMVYVTVFLLISLLTLVISLFLADSILAAPVVQQVSGTFDHNGTVTISGSAFGTKPVAAPLVWDDASGTNILDKWDGAWPNNNATYNTIYRDPMRGTPLPHSHVTRYIAGAHGDSAGANGGYNVIFFKNLPSVTFPYYVYVSWYERMDSAWVFGGDDNFKNFAYSVCCGPYQMPNNWYMNYGPPSFSSATASPQYQHNDDGGSLENPDENGHNGWWLWGANPTSRWLKIEMAIKLTGQTDGYIKLWEDGVLKDNYLGSTDKYPGTARTIGFGGYARNYGQPNNWRYFGDVYVDTTLARVVLANNQTLSKATIIEPQIPSIWSDGSIGLTVNLGKFTAGQTAYLFVVDPSGVSNAVGFPVTVGGTSGSGSDATPPPSSSSGDSSTSGGSGCGFVKDDNNGKGLGAKGEGLALMIMLIIILAVVALIRRVRYSKSILFFIIFLFHFSIANATEYYVDQNNSQSSDSNAGTEILPWKTMYRAMAAPLQPGDTVHVMAGTYDASVGGTWSQPALRPSSSGVQGKPITFRAEPRQSVILDTKNTPSTPAIGVRLQNYIVIDGFVIPSAEGKGIAVFGISGVKAIGVVLQNNIIHGVWQAGVAGDNTDGIRLEYTSGTIVRNNIIYNVDNPAHSENAAGIKMYHNDTALIENNEIYNTVSGIFDKEQGDNNTFRRNYLHNVKLGIYLQSGGSGNSIIGDQMSENVINQVVQGIGILPADGTLTDNITIANNVIANYTDTGVFPASTGTFNIYNNIFHRTGSSLRGDLFTYNDPPNSIGLMDYNLFATEPKFYIGVYQTNRVISTLQAWQNATVHDSHSNVADAAFVDAATGDFHLKANSPAIGAGRVGGVSTGAVVNMGAYPTGNEVIGPTDGWTGGGGSTPPPSSSSGGDTSASGGSGCGFVKDDGKGQGVKGEGLALVMMLIIALAGIALVKGVRFLNKILFFTIAILLFHFSLAEAWTVNATWEKFNVGDNGGDNNLGSGDGIWVGGNITSAQSTYAHSGTKSLRFYFQQGIESTGIWEWHMPTNIYDGEELWARFYLYAPVGFDWTANPITKIFRVPAVRPDKTAIGNISVLATRPSNYECSGSPNNFGYIVGGADSDIYRPNVCQNRNTGALNFLTTGKWHALELYIRVSSSGNGIYRIWHDGELIWEHTGFSNIPPGGYLYNGAGGVTPESPPHFLGWWNGGPSQDQYFYIDDFSYTNERPSNQDAEGNYMIGPTDWQSGGDGGATPPSSSSSGGDSSASGGSGCGFVKDNNVKGQKAKGEGLSLIILLIITLAGIALAKRKVKT